MRLTTLSLLAALLAAPVLAEAGDNDPSLQNDVVYGKGGDEDLRLDLASPAGEGPFPAVVVIHGGGWSRGNKAQFRFLIKMLAENGYVAASVGYRLAPAARSPSQVEDVKCAVRFLRAKADELHIDKEHIGAIGFSAGGHLALMLGVADKSDALEGSGGYAKQSSRVQAVVNFFGPAELRGPSPNPVAASILRTFIGGSFKEKPKAYAKASPVTFISKDDAPVQTHHGTADPLVPYEQATILKEALDEAGVRNELHSVEGAGHGWRGAALEESLSKSLAWFDRHLKNASEAPKAEKPKAKKRKKFY